MMRHPSSAATQVNRPQQGEAVRTLICRLAKRGRTAMCMRRQKARVSLRRARPPPPNPPPKREERARGYEGKNKNRRTWDQGGGVGEGGGGKDETRRGPWEYEGVTAQKSRRSVQGCFGGRTAQWKREVVCEAEYVSSLMTNQAEKDPAWGEGEAEE